MNRRSRFLLSTVFVVVGIAGLCWWFAAHRQQRRLNVVLITLDTTRADHLGCYGHSAALTPVVDALAKDGVRFEHAYATVPLTLPSHASMLTGCYPPEHGIHLNGRGPLSEQVPTLAEVFRDARYATGAFIGAVVLYGRSGLNRGFEVYDDDMAGGERHGHESHLMRKGALVVDSALAWLRQQQSKPFFCWVHLYDPHAPFEGHAEIFGERFHDSPYDGDIAYTDLQAGRLIKYLKQQGLYERTLIVVAGDHGEGFGEHDELEHGFQLYNATLRAPLIVACPTRITAARTVSAPVSLVDLFPTILGLAGLSSRSPISGMDLSAACLGASLPPRACYSETEACYAAYRWAPQTCVTTDRWKFIQTVRPELYDLQSDPQELNNLAASEAAQLQEMEQLYANVRAQMRVAPASDVQRDAKHWQQLRALGYASGTSLQPADDDQPLPDVKDRIRFYNEEVSARQLLRDAPDDAVTALRRITEQVPDFTPAWLSLGSALQTLKRPEEAIQAYHDALTANPDAADAHFELAKLFHSQGDRDQAVEHYQAVLKLDGHYAMAHVNLASILADAGDAAAARRHFELGLEEFPDSTVGLFNFGLFCRREGDPATAIKYLTRAAQLDPALSQVHYQLGLTLVELGEIDQAVQRFEHVLRLNPRHAGAREQLRGLQGN